MEYRLRNSDREKTCNKNTVRGDSMSWDEPWAPHVLRTHTSRARAYAWHSNPFTHAGITNELHKSQSYRGPQHARHSNL